MLFSHNCTTLYCCVKNKYKLLGRLKTCHSFSVGLQQFTRVDWNPSFHQYVHYS